MLYIVTKCDDYGDHEVLAAFKTVDQNVDVLELENQYDEAVVVPYQQRYAALYTLFTSPDTGTIPPHMLNDYWSALRTLEQEQAEWRKTQPWYLPDHSSHSDAQFISWLFYTHPHFRRVEFRHQSVKRY